MKAKTPITDAVISDKETFCFDATDLEPAMALVEHARTLERVLTRLAENCGALGRYDASEYLAAIDEYKRMAAMPNEKS